MYNYGMLNREEYKRSLESFFIGKNITHMITVNSNTPKMGDEIMCKLTHQILTQASSHVYKKKHIREKFFYVFFIEKNEGGNTHSHVLFTIPENPKEDYFLEILRKKSKIIIPRSSIDIQPITNVQGAINYCSKDLFKNNNLNSYQLIYPFKVA